MSITNKDIQELFLTVGATEDISSYFTDANYEGFDPLRMRERVVELKWNSEELIKLLVFYCVRGTSIKKKAVDKSSKQCRSLIASLTNKGLCLTPKTRDDITVARLVATFPDVVSKLIAKYGTKCRVLAEDHGTIDRFLKFSAGASLCMDEDQLAQWIVWATEQDKIINPAKHDANNVQMYARVQYNSTLFDTKARVGVQQALKAIK